MWMISIYCNVIIIDLSYMNQSIYFVVDAKKYQFGYTKVVASNNPERANRHVKTYDNTDQTIVDSKYEFNAKYKKLKDCLQ